MLNHTARITAEGLKAEYCKVMEYLPADNRLLVRAGVGWDEGVVGHATIGADLASPAGCALRTGKPVISNHLENEQRFRIPDIVLLDLGLPDGDGKEVIRRAREWSDLPIIVLSAREREAEKIDALDLGADDYVNKPFNVGELLARMRTALRHRMQRKAEIPVLRVGNLEVDAIRHRATRAGAELKLTPKEFQLLLFLAKHAGRVVTHKQILTAVWGPAHSEDTQYLRVYVGQLRQKIEERSDDPRIIQTEPGIGYRIAEN
jgi:two-component system, OmpR family, KDP operon response regulator KdpE